MTDQQINSSVDKELTPNNLQNMLLLAKNTPKLDMDKIKIILDDIIQFEALIDMALSEKDEAKLEIMHKLLVYCA